MTCERVRTLLIVSGAREFARYPAARTWAMDRVDAALELLDPARDVVASGGSRDCPDQWAREIARVRGLRWFEYRLDGQVYTSDGRAAPWWHASERPPATRWPLTRNEALVRCGARYRRAGTRVALLALVPDWPRATHGTEHTATLAMGAGLEVWPELCPRPLGPAIHPNEGAHDAVC